MMLMLSVGLLYVVSRSMAVFAGVVVVLVLRVVDARAGDALHGDCWRSHRPVRKKAACGEAEADFHPV